MSQDRELFSDRMLEGEYTTWTLRWTQNYGAGADLGGIDVDNLGNAYVTDGTANTSYTINRAGTSTTRASYRFLNFTTGLMANHWTTFLRPGSLTGKYILARKTNVPIRIEVWRYGVNIYQIAWQVLLPDANTIGGIMISPNGRYIAVIFQSIATGNKKYVQLYEGV